ncbi:uncharacterized protein F5147DRAFT_779511 [Suillus discolor]|uniref:Uncharacterized protein n=1 Tax=Suillus discolor TaxID=1912936 RepID=A0A9P7JNK8_9AGAM|nr:uncharacterized protein F5147DRAFT_779511 [Suillus discolor]KAG2092946.1 hypothetical protein F5147DRAFT_779511 [Suillus discolor]
MDRTEEGHMTELTKSGCEPKHAREPRPSADDRKDPLRGYKDYKSYTASINQLVNVQTLKIRQFQPVSVYPAEYLSGSCQELPPPSSNPSQAAPSSSTSEPLIFIPYMPNFNVPGPQMQPPTSSKTRTSSRRCSGHVGMGTGSGSQRGRAAPTAPVLSPHQSPHRPFGWQYIDRGSYFWVWVLQASVTPTGAPALPTLAPALLDS